MTTDKAPRTPRPRKATAANVGAGPAATRPPRRPGKPSNDDKLTEALAQTYAGIGLGLGKALPLFGTEPEKANAVGVIIAAAGPDAAAAWVTLAKTNPAVRKQLERFTEAGGWGSVIFAHLSLGMAVAMALRAPSPEVAQLIAQMAAAGAMPGAPAAPPAPTEPAAAGD